MPNVQFRNWTLAAYPMKHGKKLSAGVVGGGGTVNCIEDALKCVSASVVAGIGILSVTGFNFDFKLMPKSKQRFFNTPAGISGSQLFVCGGLLAEAAPESMDDIFHFISKFVLR